MLKFTDGQLKAYLEAVSERFSLGIRVSEFPARQHEQSIEFKGRMPGMRRDRTFVLPVEVRDAGVLVARSVLYGPDPARMQWLVNGQASANCREAVYIGAGSDNAVSLHPSRTMLKEWTHGRLDGMPDDRKQDALRHFDETYAYHDAKGLYGDGVCIGSYVDGGETLKLRLTPVSETDVPDAEAAAPGMR